MLKLENIATTKLLKKYEIPIMRVGDLGNIELGNIRGKNTQTTFRAAKKINMNTKSIDGKEFFLEPREEIESEMNDQNLRNHTGLQSVAVSFNYPKIDVDNVVKPAWIRFARGRDFVLANPSHFAPLMLDDRYNIFKVFIIILFVHLFNGIDLSAQIINEKSNTPYNKYFYTIKFNPINTKLKQKENIFNPNIFYRKNLFGSNSIIYPHEYSIKKGSNLSIYGIKANEIRFNSLNSRQDTYFITKGFNLIYRLSPQTYLTTKSELGYTGRPMEVISNKFYHVDLGVNLKLFDKLGLGGNLNMGSFMNNKFFSTDISLKYQLANDWQLSSSLGICSMFPNTSMSSNPYSLYGGLDLIYISDNRWYLYGTGNLATSKYNPTLSLKYSSFIGGGFGYLMPYGGNIGVGVKYVWNPYTHKMEPVFNLDLSGIITFLIEKTINGNE